MATRRVDVDSVQIQRPGPIKQEVALALLAERAKVQGVTHTLTSHGGLPVLGAKKWMVGFSGDKDGCDAAVPILQEKLSTSGRKVTTQASKSSTMRRAAGPALKLPGQR